jgi:hypothetical protein
LKAYCWAGSVLVDELDASLPEGSSYHHKGRAARLTHGTHATDVVETPIEEEIRLAIKNGLLDKDDLKKIQQPGVIPASIHIQTKRPQRGGRAEAVWGGADARFDNQRTVNGSAIGESMVSFEGAVLSGAISNIPEKPRR